MTRIFLKVNNFKAGVPLCFIGLPQKIKIKKVSGKGKRACVKDLIFIVPFLRLAKRGVCVCGKKRGVWRSSRAWIWYGAGGGKVDQVEKASVTSLLCSVFFSVWTTSSFPLFFLSAFNSHSNGSRCFVSKRRSEQAECETFQFGRSLWGMVCLILLF